MPRMTRRPQVVLFFETYETAALVRRTLGTGVDVRSVSDLPSLKLALNALTDALVVEHSGLITSSLTALHVAARSHVVPRRILLAMPGVIEGVIEALQSESATALVTMPRCGDALREAIKTPVEGERLPAAA